MPVSNPAFQPSWTSAPGETIADALKHRHISLADFARATNQSVSDARAVLDGSRPITVALAQELVHLIGGSVEFWIARDFQFRHDAERLRLEVDKWVSDLPLRDMTNFGWISGRPGGTGAAAEACLRFFGVSSVRAWHRHYSGLANMAAFRTSSSLRSTRGAVAAWLRRGEIEAAAIECEPWNASGFRDSLGAVRRLTKLRGPDRFLPELRRMCARNGVAVVVVRAPQGCRASGATRFLSAQMGLVQLSFRYLTDDQFWFTFFHEAGHLLLHEHGLRSGEKLILEGIDSERTVDEEAANSFAEDTLLPRKFRDALASHPASADLVIRLAVRAGISPGIVVGQLQHRGVGYERLNRLKRRYVWR